MWERLAPGALQTLSTRTHRKICFAIATPNKMFYQNAWHNCRAFIWRDCRSSEGFNSRDKCCWFQGEEVLFLLQQRRFFLVLPGNHAITQSILALKHLKTAIIVTIFIAKNFLGFSSLEIPSQVDNSSNQSENHSQWQNWCSRFERFCVSSFTSHCFVLRAFDSQKAAQ